MKGTTTLRKIVTIAMTAAAVLLGGLSVAAPAQATFGDSRACVTQQEYDAIKTGQSKAQVKRILDGRGKRVNAQVRQYNVCGFSAQKVRIEYNQPYGAANAKVARKFTRHLAPTHPLLWKSYRSEWKTEMCVNAALYGKNTAGRIEARSWRPVFKDADSRGGTRITAWEQKWIDKSRTLPHWAVQRDKC